MSLGSLLEVQVDVVTTARQRLRGKPAPDSFLAAAKMPGVSAEQAAVFEDALAGVAAGVAGGLRFVAGVDRFGHGYADAPRAHGAHIVVGDLAPLMVGAM